MAVNDTVQLSVIGTVRGQNHVHTLHFRLQEINADEAGLIDAWQAAARTSYRGLFDTRDTPVDRIVARQVCGNVPLRAPAEETEVAPNRVGTLNAAGNDQPQWLAAVSSVRTAFGGKERRGRFFIGGLWEDMTTGAVLEPAHLARLQAYNDALLNAFKVGGTVAGYKLVVHSRKLAKVPGQQCQNSSTLVTAIQGRSALGTMKSRRQGSGT